MINICHNIQLCVCAVHVCRCIMIDAHSAQVHQPHLVDVFGVQKLLQVRVLQLDTPVTAAAKRTGGRTVSLGTMEHRTLRVEGGYRQRMGSEPEEVHAHAHRQHQPNHLRTDASESYPCTTRDANRAAEG